MTVFKICSAAAAILLVSVQPGEAQHRGGGGHARGGSASRGGSVRVASRAISAPRAVSAPHAVVSRGYSVGRSVAVAPRAYSYGAPRVFAARPRGGVVVGRAVPRVGGARVFGGGFYRPYPFHFYRPYYAFRPRFSLGFGLWVGFPVAYTYGYYDPFYPYPYYAYPYPYPYPYGYSYPYPPPYGYSYPGAGYPSYPTYPTAGYPGDQYPASGYPAGSYPQVADPPATGVQMQANTGGLSFEITPSSAELLVDDHSVGTVGDFTPSTQPLGLSAGRHHVEIRAPGYRTMSFDVDIIPGQVIPYRGELQR